jgi:vacuolar iron transporter family protein
MLIERSEQLSPKKSLEEAAIEGRKGELTDYTIYSKLSHMGKDKKLCEIFSKLAATEHKHYLFWGRYCKYESVRPDYAKVYTLLFLRHLLGAAFVVKYLESTEGDAVKNYSSLRALIPSKDKKLLEMIIKDEESHEKAFADQIQDSYIKYVSFIVLGLADALVEVTAIYTGSLGVYHSTILTGLAGIIAGAAASISMASAAYLQAKQGFKGSPFTAAGYTGASYFLSTLVLAAPYFLTSTMFTAMASSIALCVLIIASVSWYNSIMTGSNFKKDFTELAGIMFATAIILFIIGMLIRHVFGISV